MRRCISRISLVVAILGIAALAGATDVSTRGDIVGTVTSPDGALVAGATVTVAGEGLIQRQVEAVTGDNGVFRFPNLPPGRYSVTIVKEGFAPTGYDVDINVGRTTSLQVILQVGEFTGEVEVVDRAPLVDPTSPSLSSQFDVEELKLLPTNRNFFDTIDSTAGFSNRSAYGAGGNVEGYDYFGYGAATNAYQVNGVSTSNLEFGNTWVQPNYDTIQEVQVVGPGSGAEYAGYSGAVINVVTKSGTNEFHGSLTGYYTDHNLLTDNSEGIKDLEQDTTKYNVELSGTLGGPIIREKLLFFASAAITKSENAAPGSEYYDDLDEQSYSARLDWLVSGSHTLTGMVTSEPILLDNLGLEDVEATGTDVGFYREQDSFTAYLGWLGVWGDRTLSEVRYNYVDGDLGRIPNAPLEIPNVYDSRDGLTYGSQGFQRKQLNEKDQVLATVTHFVDGFLSGSHELKGGLDYEDAWTQTNLESSPNGMMWIFPLGADLNYLGGLLGYNTHQTNRMERTGAFVQDKATFGGATITLGVRYDQPTTYDDNTGKTLLDFEQWSPRLGVTYDFSGQGKSLGRLSWGRYYDKVPTYGVGTYAGTGMEPIDYYGLVTTEDLDPTDWQYLHDLLYQPENFLYTFETQSIPVEEGIKGPYVDVLSAGFDQQLGDTYALSLSYVHRRTEDFVLLVQWANPHEYEPFEYTSDFTGRTFTLYRVTNPEVQREFALGNRDFNYQQTDMAIVQFRRRFVNNLEFDASVTWENTTGTRDNNECGILSLCSNGVDTDPNWEQNDFFTQGALSQQQEWQLKFRGTYLLPYDFQIGWDLRWYSGRPYGAVQYAWTIPDLNDPYYQQPLLEPKDARERDDGTMLNLRLGKDFNLGGSSALSILIDALNVLNEQIDVNTNVQNNIDAVYGRESEEQGEPVSAFGKPWSLARGREYRIGVKYVF
jgi:hypothetical protein